MKKRHLLTVLISLSAVLSMTACANNNSSNQTSDQVQESSEAVDSSVLENSTADSSGTGDVVSEPDAQEETSEAVASNENSNILIAYFTAGENSDVDVVSSASVTTVDGEAKGRLRAVADMIQDGTGGELFSIQTAVDYPGDGGELIDYAAEEQDADARPELTSHIENLDAYDTVFVGFPTWWYDMPQALYSFFDEYDFSGKTVVPFCTSSSSDLGESGELLAEAAGTGNWLEGKRFSSGTSEETVVEWLEENGLF